MSEDELTEVRRRIAYLFQGAALFDSLTVGENVAYGLREQFWNTMNERGDPGARRAVARARGPARHRGACVRATSRAA